MSLGVTLLIIIGISKADYYDYYYGDYYDSYYGDYYDAYYEAYYDGYYDSYYGAYYDNYYGETYYDGYYGSSSSSSSVEFASGVSEWIKLDGVPLAQSSNYQFWPLLCRSV